MLIYFILFFFLLCFVVIENMNIEILPVFKFLVVAILISISGFRYEIGSDYHNYVFLFDHPDDYPLLEYGFKYLVLFIKFMGGSVQHLFLFTSALTILLLAYTINKYNGRFFFTALSVYVISFVYFESMNTVRQAIAMSFMCYAVCSYFYNRRLILFMLFVVLSSLFHSSAVLIGVLSFFLLKFTYENKGLYPYSILLLLSFVLGHSINMFFSLLTEVSSLLGYAQYMDNFEQRGVETGLYQYILNGYAFLFIAFAHNNKLHFTKFDFFVLRMFLISIILYNTFIEFYIGLRFYWYFFIYLMFFVPVFLKRFRTNQRNLIFIFLMSPIFVFTVISLSSIKYSPYHYTFNF